MTCIRTAPLLVAAILCCGLGGCAYWPGMSEGPRYTLTLHQVVSGSDLGRGRVLTLAGFNGKTVVVHPAPLLSSSSFVRIEKAAKTGEPPALMAFLDRHGQYVWMQIRGNLIGQSVAVAVDGWCQSITTVTAMGTPDAEVICLPGPWNEAEANAVITHAAENYSLLNDAHSQ